MKFYNLLLELTKDEEEKSKSIDRVYKDFGPLFKNDRTIIHKFKITDDTLIKQLNLTKSNNKTDVTLDSIKDDIEKTVKEKSKLKIKAIDVGRNKVSLEDGREIKLTKVLSKIKTDEEFFVVISHNPVDIAGMSTDKNWKSCMGLRGGVYHETVFNEIKHGGMVAYVIKGVHNDMQKIMNDHKANGLMQQKSLGRLAIKRFVNVDNDKEFYFESENVCYRVAGADKILESNIFKFSKTINDILFKSNLKTEGKGSIYKRKGDSYSDSLAKYDLKNMDDINKLSDEDILSVIEHDPELIGYIEHPSYDLQYGIVQFNPQAILNIQNPHHAIVAWCIEQDSEVINYLDIEDLVNATIYNSGLYYIIIEGGEIDEDEYNKMLYDTNNSMFEIMVNYVDEDFKIMAVSENAEYIIHIDDPSEDVLKAAILNDPSIIGDIDKEYVSDKMGKFALETLGKDGIKKNRIYYDGTNIKYMGIWDDKTNKYKNGSGYALITLPNDEIISYVKKYQFV